MNDSYYAEIDTSKLTVDDALQDKNWNRKPADFFDFVSIDRAVLEAFADFTAEETHATMLAIRAYCIDGIEPDYSQFTTATRLAIRSILFSHRKRIESEYLKRYKAFVGGKQGALQRQQKTNKDI